LPMESVTNRMMRSAQNELYFGGYHPIERDVEKIARLTLEEVGARLTAADMVWGPLNYPRDTAADPLAEAAGCFVDVVDADGVAFRQPASPARFPGADDGPKRPAPKLGQHTREVLAQAGYDDGEIDRLVADGAAT